MIQSQEKMLIGILWWLMAIVLYQRKEPLIRCYYALVMLAKVNFCITKVRRQGKKKGGSSFSAVATEISRKLFYFVGLYWVADMHVHNYFMIYLRSSVMLFKIKVRVYFQIILFIYLITINVIIKPICSWFSCFAIWLQESNWTSMLVSAFCDPGLRCRHRRKFWFQNLRKPASLPICKRRRQKRRGETLGQPRLPLCAEVKFFPNRGRNCWERETRLFSSCHQCDEHWPQTPILRNGSRGANHTPTLPHRECCLSLPLSHTCWLCHAAHACKQVCPDIRLWEKELFCFGKTSPEYV